MEPKIINTFNTLNPSIPLMGLDRGLFFEAIDKAWRQVRENTCLELSPDTALIAFRYWPYIKNTLPYGLGRDGEAALKGMGVQCQMRPVLPNNGLEVAAIVFCSQVDSDLYPMSAIAILDR